MFAVVVTFKIKPEQMSNFLPLMIANAEASLEKEEGCHQFDVVTDPAYPNEVFLYELYSDEAAFKIHLGSEHFKVFDAATSDMLESKVAKKYGEVRQ